MNRLTALKKWFEHPGRPQAFAVWIALRASSRKGKAVGAAAELFKASRALLAGANKSNPDLDRFAAQKLHDGLNAFQDKYQNQPFGPARIVHNWDLMIVEQGLDTYFWYADSPAHGYKLAADYRQNYDSRYGPRLGRLSVLCS